ncbi:MAG TPA: hypothetical protein VEC16_03220 [Alphaproteobacteria bacterium]|nr:hypothetical protein [Alphaproteobacteria bacterium]
MFEGEIGIVTGMLNLLQFTTPEKTLYTSVLILLIGLLPLEIFYSRYITKFGSHWDNLKLLPKIFISMIIGGIAFLSISAFIASLKEYNSNAYLSNLGISIFAGFLVYICCCLTKEKSARINHKSNQLTDIGVYLSISILLFITLSLVYGSYKTGDWFFTIIILFLMAYLYSLTDHFEKNYGELSRKIWRQIKKRIISKENNKIAYVQSVRKLFYKK